MKHESKKKAHQLAEDGDTTPPVKRTADEFDTAYFIAEATLSEPPEPTRPVPVPEPPAPAAVPPPLAPMAAVWPSPTPSPGVAKPATTQTSLSLAAQSAQPSSQSKLPKSPPASPRGNVTFLLLEPEAKRVSLSGEFNDWSPEAMPMKRHADGHWETTIALAPGRYQYKFIVDGQWIPDPLARENVWNQQGTLNSVVEVRA
jgi:hypothetical protein